MISNTKYIKKKKRENIILKIIIIVVLIFTIIYNSKTYITIFNINENVTNVDELNGVINDNQKFVTLDLTDASILKYSLVNDLENVDIYSLKIDNYNVLIFLTKNTILTNRVTLKKVSYDDNMNSIKERIEESDSESYFDDIYFTNINISNDLEIIELLFLFEIILIILMILTIPIDAYFYINPTKTRKYKKLLKKENLEF